MKSQEKTKQKKVAVLIRDFNPYSGGAEKYCFELTRVLSKKYHVSVLCQTYDGPVSDLQIIKIPKIKRPRYLNQLLFSFLSRKYIQDNKFDVIHSHDMVTYANVNTIHVPTVKSNISRKLLSSNFVNKFLIYISPRIRSYLWLENKQMNVCQDTPKHIIAVSDLLKKNITSSYAGTEYITKVISPGISLDKSILSSKKKFLISNNIKPNSFIILFVGHSFRRKGLQTLVDAFAKINNSSIYIVVAGRGDSNEINFPNEKVKKNIIFLGGVSDMSSIYPSVDIMVHPTLGDTYGMAVLEAMYHKIPVILSDKKYCGISSDLNESNSIFISNPLDSIDLSKKILYLLNNIHIRRDLGINAYKFAKNKSWEHISKEYENVFQNL